MDLRFAITEKDFNHDVELVPNGKKIKVTKENVLSYVYAYADYKMNV